MAKPTLLVTAALVLSAFAATAQVPLPAAGTYAWHGEHHLGHLNIIASKPK